MKTNWFISNSIIKTLVYANVFIAFCAMAQVYLTYSVFNIPFNFSNNSYLFFILLSTFLQYNMQRGYMINENNIYEERSQWLLKHKKTLLFSLGISLFIVLFLCNNLSWTSIGIMIGAEVVSTLYYLPPFNFRRFGYIKPFLISMVWVISCSIVPLIENHLINHQSIWFVISQFCYITVLCLLFDIKDAEQDYLTGINTYANKFGASRTKIISFCFLIVAFLSSYLFNIKLIYLIPTIILSLVLVITVFVTNEKKHSFYFYLWIDGILIFQSLLYNLII